MPDDTLDRDLTIVASWFTYHAPNAHQVHLLEEARQQFHSIAAWLVANVADSRERAIALTDLRKVAMAVNMAVIFDAGDA